ncbi:hypothetical protein ACOMHN_011832 [Nucella lapillus]
MTTGGTSRDARASGPMSRGAANWPAAGSNPAPPGAIPNPASPPGEPGSLGEWVRSGQTRESIPDSVQNGLHSLIPSSGQIAAVCAGDLKTALGPGQGADSVNTSLHPHRRALQRPQRPALCWDNSELNPDQWRLQWGIHFNLGGVQWAWSGARQKIGTSKGERGGSCQQPFSAPITARGITLVPSFSPLSLRFQILGPLKQTFLMNHRLL